MRVVLVGADHEENLGLEMIAASLRRAKHRVDMVPYHEAGDVDAVVDRVLARRPQMVGLAIQFQFRAHDFMLLARRLRRGGFRGHITCGGQYPTMAHAEILDGDEAVDSIVLHEGERTAVELADSIARGDTLEHVAGLALRGPEAKAWRTRRRPLCENLDELPFAHRWRAHSRHLGIPYIPICGSRGCWGSCAFCGISAYYRAACVDGGGRKLRLRSPENLAAEMATLWQAQGGPCIFCFHDDTLLLPRPADTLERLRRVRQLLDDLGVGRAAIIGKTRPDTVTPELALGLRRLGVIRMFVGIENASQAGQDHLNRRTRTEDLHRALDAFEAAGIFVCYNLLLFEPDGSLGDVAENIAFIRRHSNIPVNFCRAEPYHGTPLHARVKERGTLIGSYLGWDYRIHDDRTELLFRMCAAAFRERNYHAAGVANRYIGLGYTAQVLRCFYDLSEQGTELVDRVDRLIRDVSGDTADLLEQAHGFVAGVDLADRDRIEREAALFGLRVSAHDRIWLGRVDELTREMSAYAAERSPRIERPVAAGRLREVAQRLAVAGCLVATLPGCGGRSAEEGGGAGVAAGDSSGAGGQGGGHGGMVGDGGGPSGGYGGYGTGGEGGAPPGGYGGNGGFGGLVGDGGGPSGGYGGYGGYGGTGGEGGAPPGGWGGMLGDGGGPSGGYAGDASNDRSDGADARGGDARGPDADGALGAPDGASDGAPDGASDGPSDSEPDRILPVDPPPVDAGVDEPVPVGSVDPGRGSSPLVEHWRDTSPRRTARSSDLPLFYPPAVSLQACVEADGVRVHLECDACAAGLRWESDGRIEGEGRDVLWYPASDEDQIRVAVRTAGGVAISTLRACTLAGDRSSG
jgi:anaerobic magnesium-protoporphyrin IX monomethyl ester cyclase